MVITITPTPPPPPPPPTAYRKLTNEGKPSSLMTNSPVALITVRCEMRDVKWKINSTFVGPAVVRHLKGSRPGSGGLTALIEALHKMSDRRLNWNQVKRGASLGHQAASLTANKCLC